MSAEHSTYFTALRSLASFSAVSGVMGFCLFLASFSMVDGSSRKSIWVPTSRKGVFGQWWVISGTHWSGKGLQTGGQRRGGDLGRHELPFRTKFTFSLTFSKEEGETTEKQTRKTSVCG